MRVYLEHVVTQLRSANVIQALAAFGIRITSGVVGYALFAVIARLSGPEEFGVFSILFSIVMAAGIVGSFGQQTFLVKEVPRARAQQSLEQERGAYIFATASTLLSAAVAGLFVAIYVTIERVGNGSLILVTSTGILASLYGVSQMTIGALRVQDLTLYAMASRDLLWRVTAISVLLAYVYLYDGDQGVKAEVVFVVLSCSLAPILVAHLVHMFRYFRRKLRYVRSEVSLKEWIDTSSGMTLVSLISGSDLYIYTVLIGSMVGKLEAGAFFASIKTVELLNMFMLAVTLVTAPELSRAVAKGNRCDLQRVCNGALLVQCIPVFFASLVIVLCAPVLLSLFDSSFSIFSNMLRMLCLAMLVNALSGATGLILQLMGHHWLQAIYQGGALALSIVLLPISIQLFGIYGVAASYILSKVLWNTLAVVAIRRRGGVDPSLFGLIRTT